MPNFDINVYNFGAGNDEEDAWMLCPYTLVDTPNGKITGIEMYKYNLVLSQEEAQQLGLDNRDLWFGDDEWIDKDTLVREFGVSDRIQSWVGVVESVIDKQHTT